MNLTRTLLGLLICISMLPLCSLSFKYVSNLDFDYNELNDEIALCQLREILLISYDMHICETSLDFIYKNKNFSLSLVNDKLLLQPGTQIFLNDVDSLHFKKDNDCIYVIYERNNKKYERVIGKASGIYLDDFSDCTDEFDEYNSEQE